MTPRKPAPDNSFGAFIAITLFILIVAALFVLPWLGKGMR